MNVVTVEYTVALIKYRIIYSIPVQSDPLYLFKITDLFVKVLFSNIYTFFFDSSKDNPKKHFSILFTAEQEQALQNFQIHHNLTY